MTNQFPLASHPFIEQVTVFFTSITLVYVEAQGLYIKIQQWYYYLAEHVILAFEQLDERLDDVIPTVN